MTPTSDQDAIRVFVSGSCVSRDLLPALRDDAFELAYYSPRQSLIGLHGSIEGLDSALDLTSLKSRFQRRAVEGTIRADLLEQVRRHGPMSDLVLWDITDERLGVYEYRGGYVTRTVELISSGADSRLRERARYIPFGAPEHQELWARALSIWADTLRKLGLADRTAIVAPAWAESLDDGSPSPLSFGTAARDFNRLAENYYRMAASRLSGSRTIGCNLETTAARNHQWGPAAFHFDAATNQALGRSIVEVVYDDDTFPPPRPRVTQIGRRSVEVTARKTWASSFALRALHDKDVAHRSAYQDQDVFRVTLTDPGEYVFRVFHRSGRRTAAVNSEPIRIN